jgi:hypothetical protein
MATIALIESVKLTDGSNVYNVQLRCPFGSDNKVICRIDCYTLDYAMAIARAINEGAVSVETLN